MAFLWRRDRAAGRIGQVEGQMNPAPRSISSMTITVVVGSFSIAAMSSLSLAISFRSGSSSGAVLRKYRSKTSWSSWLRSSDAR